LVAGASGVVIGGSLWRLLAGDDADVTVADPSVAAAVERTQRGTGRESTSVSTIESAPPVPARAVATVASGTPIPAGVVPRIVPIEQFYVVSKNATDPVVAVDGWSLEISG